MEQNVAIAIELSYRAGLDNFSGMLAYMQRSAHWNPILIQHPEQFSAFDANSLIDKGLDGAILTMPIPDDALKALLKARIPLVAENIDNALLKRRERFIVHVDNDNTAIGRLGAEHLRSCGKFSTFAFLSCYTSCAWSRTRARAFFDNIGANTVRQIPAGENGIADGMSIKRALLRLDKPIALMCDCDKAAISAVEACSQAGLKIPQQVAVLGVDNDECLCESAHPMVSSVLPGHREMGMSAFRALDCLIRRRKVLSQTLIAPHAVIARQSTQLLPPSADLVNRAKRFISENACDGISVAEVAAHLNVSRRLAELRFSQLEGHSIRNAIIRRKKEEAVRLLEKTTLPLAEIAHRTGFGSATHLCHFFRTALSRTPSSFRN